MVDRLADCDIIFLAGALLPMGSTASRLPVKGRRRQVYRYGYRVGIPHRPLDEGVRPALKYLDLFMPSIEREDDRPKGSPMFSSKTA